MQGKKFFLNVQKGEFSESRTKENRNVFTKLTGHIVNVNYKTTDYGETMRVQLIDENNFYMLSMFVNSRVANGFYMMIKNIDLNHEIELNIRAEDGKDFLTIKQFGAPVLWFYTMENAHELPREIEDRKAYLKQMVLDEIAPALAKKLNPYPNNAFYTPQRKGLQGGYFDKYNTNVRTPKGISDEEREHYRNNNEKLPPNYRY